METTFPRISFSLCWSDRLGAEILKRSEGEPYRISCWPSSEDFEALAAAINVGIDSHLEAVAFEQTTDHRGAPLFLISAETLSILIRRLLNGEGVPQGLEDSGDELFSASLSLASGICETLEIELI